MKKMELLEEIKRINNEISNKGAVISNQFYKDNYHFRYINQIGYTENNHLTHYKYLKVNELKQIYKFMLDYLNSLES